MGQWKLKRLWMITDNMSLHYPALFPLRYHPLGLCQCMTEGESASSKLTTSLFTIHVKVWIPSLRGPQHPGLEVKAKADDSSRQSSQCPWLSCKTA
jgi:hypothetical protein